MSSENNEIQDQLKLSMKQEISMMREILANMHQEELSLLLNDKLQWNQLMRDRSQMILRLSDLRKIRLQATEKLTTSSDTENSEIFFLRDQILALTERMNHQNVRNQDLYAQVEHRFDLNLPPTSHPSLQPSPIRQKKKNGIATIDPKDYKS